MSEASQGLTDRTVKTLLNGNFTPLLASCRWLPLPAEPIDGMLVAIVIVIALIAITLGRREGMIVATAVPITLDLIVSGLASALIFGLLVSGLFTLVLVPMVQVTIHGTKHATAATG